MSEILSDLKSVEKPLVLEIAGEKRIVLAMCDIDGTVNDEEEPESARLATIIPAKEAFGSFRRMGIRTGLTSARSTGEVLVYLDALEVDGPVIGEDGGVIVLPKVSNLEEKDLVGPLAGCKLVSHNGRKVLILTKADMSRMTDFVNFIIAKAGEEGIESPVVNSITSSDSELFASTRHHSFEMMKASRDRLASAYFDKPSLGVLALLRKYALDFGLRVIGNMESSSVYGVDANKGKAIEVLNLLAPHFYPDGADVSGIFFVAFGNGANDLPFLQKVNELGGISFLVAHPDGGWYIKDESRIPDYVIRMSEPYGYGIKEAVSMIPSKLEEKGVELT